MIDKNQANEYASKLTQFLTTPSYTQEFYEPYQADHAEASFEDYTQAIQHLVSQLEEEKIKDKDTLCKEIKKLKLPDDHFDC